MHSVTFTWEEHVHELAVGGPGAHLLNLGVPRVEAVVDPGQHIVAREVVRGGRGGVHVDGHGEAGKTQGRTVRSK